MVSCIECFGPKMLVISALGTDTQTIKGCEPWGGIEVLPAIFSHVVLANFSITGKLDGLFQGPRGGNLSSSSRKKSPDKKRFHPRGINIIIIKPTSLSPSWDAPRIQRPQDKYYSIRRTCLSSTCVLALFMESPWTSQQFTTSMAALITPR